MKQKSLSKKFMLRFFSGTKLFLSFFFLGSSAFASSGQDYFSDTSPTEKKDISIFVSRLSERLQGVFKEIVALSSDQPLVEKGSQSQEESKKTLVDVQDHFYAPEILALADLGVVDASREKFYPDNYLRRYELVMMLVKYRLAKTNNQLSPVVFPLRGWFFDVAQNTSYAPYVAYAEQQQWISQLITQKDGKKLFSPNKFLTKAEVCALLNLDSSHSFCSNDSIKRGEFAAVLFRGFQRNEDESSLGGQDSSGEIQPIKTSSLIGQMKTLFSMANTQ